jgi:hypothetical protein
MRHETGLRHAARGLNTELNHGAANEILRVNSRREPRRKQDPLVHGWPEQNQRQTKLAGCEAWHMLRSKKSEKRCSGKSLSGNRELGGALSAKDKKKHQMGDSSSEENQRWANPDPSSGDEHRSGQRPNQE